MTIELAFGLWLFGAVLGLAGAAYLATQLLPHYLIHEKR